MKKKIRRISLLILLFLMGMSLWSFMTPEPVRYTEVDVQEKKISLKRKPASIVAKKERRELSPILGTGFHRVAKKYPSFPVNQRAVNSVATSSEIEDIFPDIEETRTKPVIESGPIDEGYDPIITMAPVIRNNLPNIPMAQPQEESNNTPDPVSDFVSAGVPFVPFTPAPEETPTFAEEDSESNETTSTSPGFTVTYIGIIDGELVIQGTNLSGVTSLNVNGTAVDVDFTSISKTSTEIIAQALSGVSLVAGTLYNLVISDAHGQATFPIDIVLADGSVSSSKLAQGTALDGYILKYDGLAGRWVETAPDWTLNANGIHNTAGNVGIGMVLPTFPFHLNAATLPLTPDEHFFAVMRRSEGGTANDGGLGFGYFAAGGVMTGALINSTDNQNLFLGTPNAKQALTIENASGFIGIGIGATDPGAQLDVHNQFGQSTIRSRGSVDANMLVLHTTSGIQTRISQNGTKGLIGTTTDAGSSDFSIQTNGEDRILVERLGTVKVVTPTAGQTFQVGANGDGTSAVANSWDLFSDERLKKNFSPIEEPLRKISSISGYQYQWKNKKDQKQKIGVKAQEVQKVFPEVVTENKDGILSVSYDHLIAPLIEAVKELADRDDRRIRALEEENARLKKQNEELDRRLSALESSKR